jgi:3-methyladenine DNA glycosylase AlkD
LFALAGAPRLGNIRRLVEIVYRDDSMPSQSDQLARFVTAELRTLADPARAPAMAAYMKTEQPFYGVPTPARAIMMRATRDRFVPLDDKSYARNVLALWNLPHREEQYCAIAYARQHPQFITVSALPLYERMIREGAWWDFVDEIAINLVGSVYGNSRAKTRPIIEKWIDDPDMWIRRTALISHMKHKKDTDVAQLFDHCIRRSHEREFFIRKAIGWALREYSKTDPRRVRAFLKTNRQRLSNLSFAEASKHLARAK